MTHRQERITNGCNLIIKEISVQNRWGGVLATNLMKRLRTLMEEEINGAAEETEDLIALQEELNAQV